MPLPRAAPLYDKTGARTLFSAPPPAGGEDRGAALSGAQAESKGGGARSTEMTSVARLRDPSRAGHARG